MGWDGTRGEALRPSPLLEQSELRVSIKIKMNRYYGALLQSICSNEHCALDPHPDSDSEETRGESARSLPPPSLATGLPSPLRRLRVAIGIFSALPMLMHH